MAKTIAPKFGLVDKPGGRKAHRAPTPMGGGVAIWLTTVVMVVLGAGVVAVIQGSLPVELAEHVSGLWSRFPEVLIILGLGTAIMIMGLIDDRVGLPWFPRLFIQFLLATLVVVSGVRVTLFPPLNQPIIGGVLTVFWIVGLTNSFNFLDNMDGLAAGVGLIAALLFAVAQGLVGSLFVPALLLVIVGALAGFLVYNKHPATLFMGDAGSNFLGFMLGCLTVAGTFTRPGQGDSPYAVLSPLLVMAVPLYDTCSVIMIRIREGRSPFKPDRRHFSHRLVDRGLSSPQAVLTIDLVTLACGLGALLMPHLWGAGVAVVVAQTICLLGVVAILEMAAPPVAKTSSPSQSLTPESDHVEAIAASAPQPETASEHG
jgi:UDP-GlcNAc:undecaprenyl-phosphate GlcNAc-1-phosphate transferase